MPRRRTLVRAGIITTALLLAVPGVAAADPGDLDHTFGGDGIVDVAFSTQALAVAPENGLWVAGGAPLGEVEIAVVLTRLQQNGQPDPAFGDAGSLPWTYPHGGKNPTTWVTGVAALPGGGVQISGTWCSWWDEVCHGKSRSYAARFDVGGAPVLGFGDDGVIATPTGLFNLWSVEADTSLHGCLFNNPHDRLVVRRFLPDGERDPSFSGNGRMVVRIPGSVSVRALRACGATADGGTVVATADQSGEGVSALRVVKVTDAGVIDTSYGDDGWTIVAATEIDVDDAQVLSDGTAWFAGAQWSGGHPGVLGLTAEGDRDQAFGENGLAVLDLLALDGADRAHAAVRSDGSVAVTGTLPGAELVPHPYLAMLTPEGDVDTAFGDAGMVGGYAPLRYPRDLVIDSKDRMVTANTSFVVRFRA